MLALNLGKQIIYRARDRKYSKSICRSSCVKVNRISGVMYFLLVIYQFHDDKKLIVKKWWIEVSYKSKKWRLPSCLASS